jgi:hypothetical protein
VVFCKTFEAAIGGNGYVLSTCSYVLSNGSPMWSWDRVGVKNLRRRKKVGGVQEREIKVI